MSGRKATYDAQELFLRGKLAFGRAVGMFLNPMSTASADQKHYSKAEQRKRRISHAAFKAQGAARRAHRKAPAA